MQKWLSFFRALVAQYFISAVAHFFIDVRSQIEKSPNLEFFDRICWFDIWANKAVSFRDKKILNSTTLRVAISQDFPGFLRTATLQQRV